MSSRLCCSHNNPLPGSACNKSQRISHVSGNSVACTNIYCYSWATVSRVFTEKQTGGPEQKTYSKDWSCCCCTLLRLSFISFLWIFVSLAISSLAAVICASSVDLPIMRSIGGRAGNVDVPGSMVLKSAGEAASTGNVQLQRNRGEEMDLKLNFAIYRKV